MRTLARFALTISVAAALLIGCSERGAMPQVSALTVRTTSTNYKVLYSFGGSPDGADPLASLINAGGVLYGTTAEGGSYSGCGSYRECGTVFSITRGGGEKVLYSFGGSPDGGAPLAGLIDVGGTFYGTTQFGGPYNACDSYYRYPVGCGTVFSITQSGTEKVLHSFGNGNDGFEPAASLIDLHGRLYGTTGAGGPYSPGYFSGTVFSITMSGKEKMLYNFGFGLDGAHPRAVLIDVKGTLYGTTAAGGTHGGGTVFSITPRGKEKVLHNFGGGTDGAKPVAGLIDVKGTLYGTTSGGGGGNYGTVFSITPSGTEEVLYRFNGGADGAGPAASLIKVKGALYGTTESGGAYSCSYPAGCGTVFRITPKGALTVLHSFGGGTDGERPVASLVNVAGTLYGTTSDGGTSGRGTVFALTP